MSVEGFFHDAHEVYSRNPADGVPDWTWIATFATKALAESYVAFSEAAGVAGQAYEVRPV